MAQVVVPVTQVSNSPAWVPNGGASIVPLLSDANDTTTMRSPSSPDLADFQCTMGNPAGAPQDNNGHQVNIRCKVVSSAGGWIIVKVYSSGGTLAATFSTQATISTTLQTIALALNSTQAATAGFNGVKLEVIANQNGFGTVFDVAELSMQFSPNAQTVSGVTAAAAADVSAGPTLRYDQTVSGVTAAAAAAPSAPVVKFDQVVSGVTAAATASAAPRPGLSLYLTADQVLADPTVQLDVVLELHGALRTDPALADQAFYFSLKGRRTDSADSPPGVTMPPYLTDPGGVDFLLGSDLTLDGGTSEADKRSLAGDQLAGAPQLNWKQAQLSNERGQLDWMKLYTWAGRTARAWVGPEVGAFRGFTPLYTGSTLGEPLVGSESVQLQVAHPIAQMDRTIPVKRWVGIPVGLRFLTASASMSLATASSAFALSAFTVVGRYRLWAYPGSGINLLRRSGVGGAWLTLQLTASAVTASDTVGGVTESLSAPVTALDAQFHTVVYGRNGSLYWYLMVDGAVAAFGVPPLGGSPDYSSAWGFTMFEGFYGAGQAEGLDLRVYGTYYEPSEAGSLLGRAEGTEENLTALWRCDDGLGNTVTDYAGGFNATLAGVAGTDFSWVQTNLGEATLAGQVIPQVYGLVAHAKGQVIDGGQVMAGSKVRVQYKDAGDVLTQPLLRSQGVALALGTDYTYVRSPSDRTGIVQIAGASSEPFTFEQALDASLVSGQSFNVGGLLQAAVGTAGVTSASLHLPSWSAIRAMVPYDAGFVVDRDDVKLGDFLSTVLQGVAAHHRLTRGGLVAPGYVLPPVSPGPFGGPVLELQAPSATGVSFPGNPGLPSGAHTIAGWFQSFALDLDPAAASTGYVGPPPCQVIYREYNASTGKGVQLGVSQHHNAGEAGAICLWHSDLTPLVVKTAPGVVKFGRRYFIAAVWDNAGGAWIYCWEFGTTPFGSKPPIVASATGVTGAHSASGASPCVGMNTVGSLCYVGAWSGAATQSNLQAIMTAGLYGSVVGTTISAKFSAPLDDGNPATQVREAVSGTYGALPTLGDYCRWAPRLKLELDRLGEMSILTRDLVPAWSVAVQAAANFYQMKDSEILSSVAKATALALKGPGQSASWTDQALFAANREALSIVLASALRQKADAQKLLRNLLYRYSDGHGLVAVPKVDRRAALLELTDEVWLYPRKRREALLPVTVASPWSYYLAQPAAAFRVVGSKPDNKTMTADLTLWR